MKSLIFSPSSVFVIIRSIDTFSFSILFNVSTNFFNFSYRNNFFYIKSIINVYFPELNKVLAHIVVLISISMDLESPKPGRSHIEYS